MKPILHSLKVGQKVWATVEEVLAQNEILVNFQGDLLRVSNQTSRSLRPGQRIQLSVTAVSPLGFQLMESRKTEQNRQHIDFSI